MYNYKTLPNNLKLLTAPMAGTRTATVLIMVKTGSKYEDKKISGMSHFLEHMFFKGTKKRPTALAISSELDGLGAEYNAFTGKEYTGFWVKSDAEHLNLAIEIVSDMLINSVFSQAEINRERGVIMEEINMYQDNPMYYVENVFESCLYGDTPAGWDTLGTKESLLKISRKEIVDYFKSQYGAESSLVCLAGDISSVIANNSDLSVIPGLTRDPGLSATNKFLDCRGFARSRLAMTRSEPAMTMQTDCRVSRINAMTKGAPRNNINVSRYFIDLHKNNFKEKLPVDDRQSKPQMKLHFKKTDQAHLVLGARGLSYGHKDEAAAKVLASILGGSMSSRLFINLRERNGLAYYVRTHSENYTDSGYIATQAGVPVNKIDKAVGIILDEYKKLARASVSGQELNKVKQNLVGRTTLQLEQSDNVAEWYGRQAVMRMSQPPQPPLSGGSYQIYTPEEYFKKIRRVGADDIKRVAKEIFINEKLNLAVIGPYEETGKFQKMLNNKF